jgi:hypothetical protein
VSNGAELDLFFTPAPLSKFKNGEPDAASGPVAADRSKEGFDALFAALQGLDASYSRTWEQQKNWQYNTLTLNGGTVRVGISTGGVVSIDGHPFDPEGNMNTTAEAVRAAILKALPAPAPEADGKTPDEPAPVVPDPVVSITPPSDDIMQAYISIAADSIDSLRRIDVYRVLNAVAADNINGVTRGALATWIVANRPDLRDEVAAVMAEEFPGEGWTGAASTDETPPVVEPVNEPVNEPTVEPEPPVVDPEPPVIADNPQRTNDLTFFADVAAGKVDMWDDNLADKLEEMIAGYSDDSEVTAAWTEAVNAYTNFMVNAMKDA